MPWPTQCAGFSHEIGYYRAQTSVGVYFYHSWYCVAMKTIHVSEGLWVRLKVASVVRGVPMREIVEEMGSRWESKAPVMTGAEDVSRRQAVAVRELKVELED